MLSLLQYRHSFRAFRGRLRVHLECRWTQRRVMISSSASKSLFGLRAMSTTEGHEKNGLVRV